VLSAKEVFEKLQKAALAATGQDERALQIDYDALEKKVLAMLGDRKVSLLHINKHLPEGYEDQGHMNAVVVTQGNVLFDIVIGDSYYRYDIFSASDLDKIQSIDGVWEDKEKREEISFLSLRLMHGDEAHILLALNDEQRQNVLAVANAVTFARHPEK